MLAPDMANISPWKYSLLRSEERRSLELEVKPLAKGNVTLFYYLSLVGFFSLIVGTIVMLRRPPDRAALHFYAICLLFFLMYSTSYTGRLNLADWTLLWLYSPKWITPYTAMPALFSKQKPPDPQLLDGNGQDQAIGVRDALMNYPRHLERFGKTPAPAAAAAADEKAGD